VWSATGTWRRREGRRSSHSQAWRCPGSRPTHSNASAIKADHAPPNADGTCAAVRAPEATSGAQSSGVGATRRRKSSLRRVHAEKEEEKSRSASPPCPPGPPPAGADATTPLVGPVAAAAAAPRTADAAVGPPRTAPPAADDPSAAAAAVPLRTAAAAASRANRLRGLPAHCASCAVREDRPVLPRTDRNGR